MARLLVLVEGTTERDFVYGVLCPHLYSHGYFQVVPKFLGDPRQHGGVPSWPRAKKDLLRRLQEDAEVLVTTMVDYYGMPQDGDRAWPARAAVRGSTSHERASGVEAALAKDVQESLGDSRRFIPFVVIHEFEALLFSDCGSLSHSIDQEDLTTGFQAIRDQFLTPEEIDDSPETAPSKRIQSLFPRYQKPLHGNLAALEIGLNRIRRECPHFDGWLKLLEALGSGR